MQSRSRNSVAHSSSTNPAVLRRKSRSALAAQTCIPFAFGTGGNASPLPNDDSRRTGVALATDQPTRSSVVAA